MVAEDATISDWLQLIRAEYLEIPGLLLTKPQFQRLWNLDSATSDTLLSTLVEMGFLTLTHDGAYGRADMIR